MASGFLLRGARFGILAGGLTAVATAAAQAPPAAPAPPGPPPSTGTPAPSEGSPPGPVTAPVDTAPPADVAGPAPSVDGRAPTAPPGAARPATPPSVSNAELERALQADAASSPPAASADRGAATGSRSTGSLNPDLSLILDMAGAIFDGQRLQTGEHDPQRTGFNLQELELAAGANVDPYFRLDGHLAFHESGVDLEEAYGTTLGLPLGLQARFGRFLHRFGRINAMHPHTWNFVDQPLAIGRVFGGEGGQGNGVELSWLTPLPWYVEVVATAQNATGEANARSFYGDRNPGLRSPADLLYVAALEQFFPLSEDVSLAAGLSGAFGPSAGAFDRAEIWGTDLYLKYRPITRESPTVVSLTTEWLYRRRHGDLDTLSDVSSYTELFYRFLARWAVAARHDYGSPAFVGHGVVVRDPLDPDWTSTRHRVGANVTFFPTEFSRLRLQGSRLIQTDGGTGWAVFLAAELVAGAHGAHTF